LRNSYSGDADYSSLVMLFNALAAYRGSHSV